MKYEDLPKNIRALMGEEQERQVGKRDRDVFRRSLTANPGAGGFSWRNSEKGFSFWARHLLNWGNPKSFLLDLPRQSLPEDYTEGNLYLVWYLFFECMKQNKGEPKEPNPVTLPIWDKSYVSRIIFMDYYNHNGFNYAAWSDVIKESIRYPTETVGEPKDDPIRPTHYQTYGMQVIDMMIALFGEEETAIFCKLNAFKYRLRAGNKDPLEQDIAKEKWYLDKQKELTKD